MARNPVSAMTGSRLQGQLNIAKDANAVAQASAEWLVQKIAAITGNIRIVLSGGSTPRSLYRLLASEACRARIPWPRIDFFWGDERFVPHESPDSNYRMVRETLLSAAPIETARTHPIPTDTNPIDCASRYEAELRRAYGTETLDFSTRPLFHIVLLGLGSDGHTCSLLPGEPVLEERTHWVSAVAAGRNEPRITLTYPALEMSATLVFLVTGAEKEDAVRRVRKGDSALPAARIHPSGEVFWFLDSAAAGTLQE